MKLIRNICKYVLILFAICAMVVLSAFAVMMIGKVSIFGYTYLNIEKAYDIYDVQNASSDLDILVQTKNVAVEYMIDDTLTAPRVNLVSRLQGVFKDDVREVSYTKNYENGVLSVVTTEPSGLAFQSDSRIIISVPDTFNVENLTITTQTNKVKFDDQDSFSVGNLTINTTKDISGISVGDNIIVTDKFVVDTMAGRFNIDANIQGNIEIDSTIGTFIFSKDVGATNKYVQVRGETPSVEFGTFGTNPVDIKGELDIQCTSGGLVKVSGDIYGVVGLNSENIEFRANNILTKITASYGVASVKIEGELGSSTLAESTIVSGDGSVYINKVKSNNIYVSSTKNDVTIDELFGSANITNDYGSIKIKCANNMYSTTNIVAVTKNGKIDIKNISKTVTLTSTKGTINAEFVNVVGENSILTNAGVNIKVKDVTPNGSSMQYKFVATTKSGGVDVQLGGNAEFNNWDGIEAVDGYKSKTVYVNSASESVTNSISVTTVSGKITASILN